MSQSLTECGKLAHLSVFVCLQSTMLGPTAYLIRPYIACVLKRVVGKVCLLAAVSGSCS